jgi:hypothetical protein
MGCARTNERVAETRDSSAVVEVPVEDGGIERDASDEPQDGGEAAGPCIPVIINVSIEGSYKSTQPAPSGNFYSPAVVVKHLVPSDPGIESSLHTWVGLSVARPHFAAPYSAQDLCSTEEASPSYLRLACLRSYFYRSEIERGARPDRLSTIEYRIENGRKLVILADGTAYPLSENVSYNTPMPPGACATLETKIPKRNLEPLRKAYDDNNPSERCRTSTAPHRKVRATLVHQPLPNMGTFRRSTVPPYHLCRGVTGVRLVLPPSIARSQDLGILSAQCSGMCSASREINPGRIYAKCIEGGTVEAYQLGDNLYVVEEDYVRQVPLPCGVELDFQVADFAVQLGLPR